MSGPRNATAPEGMGKALAAVGIILSAAQASEIRRLLDAGRTAEAQRLMLNILNGAPPVCGCGHAGPDPFCSPSPAPEPSRPVPGTYVTRAESVRNLSWLIECGCWWHRLLRRWGW